MNTETIIALAILAIWDVVFIFVFFCPRQHTPIDEATKVINDWLKSNKDV